MPKETIGLERTFLCGQINEGHVGNEVTLMGWVQRVRNLGGLIFVWLRDYTGLVQLVFDTTKNSEQLFSLAEDLRGEYVLAIEGKVALRAKEAINTELKTGKIEILVEDALILNKAKTPPIYIESDTNESESVRLKYRYLDLRREPMQNMLRFRQRVISAIRSFLDDKDFLEVETPILTKSTPEGARDYLVPTRTRPGAFYALPQSPQIYKQLLMVGGIDRYYQIAKCFRDEDGRADRQPEFTQVDMEMSFVDETSIQNIVEGIFISLFKETMDIEIQAPFPRITYKDAMEKYGSDKPDLRFDMQIHRLDEQIKDSGFLVFEKALEKGHHIYGINAKKASGKYSRKEIGKLEEFVKNYHAKGLAWAEIAEDGAIRSSFAKGMKEKNFKDILDVLKVENGDLIFLIADEKYTALTSLGQLRVKLAKDLNLIDSKKFNLLWVIEFPLMEFDEEEKRYVTMHHPFTSPMDEDIHLMDKDISEVRAKAYDLVLNGVEMGSGSIRIHSDKLQNTMFEKIGLDEEEIEKRFGFLIEAFKYGTPPHGGFAFGIDRLIMVLLEKENLRDVIAFPKGQSGVCLMMDTPSQVKKEQLDHLFLEIKHKE